MIALKKEKIENYNNNNSKQTKKKTEKRKRKKKEENTHTHTPTHPHTHTPTHTHSPTHTHTLSFFSPTFMQGLKTGRPFPPTYPRLSKTTESLFHTLTVHARR
ncbi:MAG: hypothetical protein LGB72_03505 [Sulfurovum sp.]|nr:hypothetical protein [Sulfurovum sp.]